MKNILRSFLFSIALSATVLLFGASNGADGQWSFGMASAQGEREYQQDTMRIYEHGFGATLVVADGHDFYGARVSQTVTDKVIQYLNNSIYLERPIVWALQDACERVERYITEEWSNAWYANQGGSTLTMATVSGPYASLVNVGDSRTIVCQQYGEVLRATKDHKPDDPGELKRIKSCGGVYTDAPNDCPRVNGFALSRAFGDLTAKRMSPGAMTAKADVYGPMKIEDGDFIVLACDGIWDVMSNEEVAQQVADTVNCRTPVPYDPVPTLVVRKGKQLIDTSGVPSSSLNLKLRHAALEIVREARKKCSGDNLTVVIGQWKKS